MVGAALNLFNLIVTQDILLNFGLYLHQLLNKLDLKWILSQLALDIRSHTENLKLVLIQRFDLDKS